MPSKLGRGWQGVEVGVTSLAEPKAVVAERAARAPVDVEFRGVTKRCGAVVAVDDISFEIPRGSFHSVLGPSGCGKTTSLRLIAGFEQPDQGEVSIGERSMVGVPAYVPLVVSSVIPGGSDPELTLHMMLLPRETNEVL